MKHKKQKNQKDFEFKFFPKNRKGKEEILGPETLKIVLAILGILILIFLMVKLYSMFTHKTDVEQAKSSLDKLSSRITTLLEIPPQTTESEVLIESPNDWAVVAWPYGDSAEKPAKCSTQYCICLCQKPGTFSLSDYLDKCNGEGICTGVSNKVIIWPEPIEIKGATSLNIKLVGEGENKEVYIAENENEE